MTGKPVLAWTFPAGRLIQDVQSLTLVNNTEKVLDLIGVAGKRFLILNVKAVNCDDVARNIAIVKYKDLACTLTVKNLDSIARNAGAILNWPNTNTGAVATTPSGIKPEILEYPNRIRVIWNAGGASTGATDVDGLVIEYLELDASQMTKDLVLVKEVAVSGIDAVKSVLTGLTQAHPATMGLLIMAASSIGQIVTGGNIDELNMSDPELAGRYKAVKITLTHMYIGAQTIAAAAVVAPVVSGGLGALGSYLAVAKK